MRVTHKQIKFKVMYTQKELQKLTVTVLDSVAEEMGIDLEAKFGFPNPKKALVIEAILEKQLELEKAQSLDTKPPLHRKVEGLEEQSFRDWARANYKIGTEVDKTWHPVVLEECAEMNAENAAELRGKKPSKKKKVETQVKIVMKTVEKLEEGEQFCFVGQNKVFMTIRKYRDEKNREHVVVKTEAPTKAQPAEMDLYYKNHLAMEVACIK